LNLKFASQLEAVNLKLKRIKENGYSTINKTTF
jgi:hypothetical protein